MGSTMLQMRESVGSFMNGSITPVSGSGTTSMSLAWMGIQPRMEEPSKPSPSSNTPSVSSASGTVKCCQRPRKSMNLRSTITAFLSCAYPITSFGFGILVGLPSSGVAALTGWYSNHVLQMTSVQSMDQTDAIERCSRPHENVSYRLASDIFEDLALPRSLDRS